jgi:mannose-6-phosphate isomerase-like protein (cupin superfamily)
MSDAEATGGNVRRVSADAADRFEWGSIQWLVNAELMPGSGLTFGFVEIAPGAKNPRHLHPNCDEVLYVLEGTLEHSLGDDVFELGPGAALLIPTNVGHDARNPGVDPARVVVAYSSGERQTVLLEEEQDDRSL